VKRLAGTARLGLPPGPGSVSPARLIFAVVGPGLSVTLALLINIAFVRERCSTGGMITRYSALALALVIVVAGTLVAWQIWRDLGRVVERGEVQGRGRDRFLAGGGVLLSTLMLLLTCYAIAVALVLDGCLRGVL
jgi:hypothetical protein